MERQGSTKEKWLRVGQAPAHCAEGRTASTSERLTAGHWSVAVAVSTGIQPPNDPSDIVEIVKAVFENDPIPFQPITRKPRTPAQDQQVLAKAIKKAQWIIDHSTTSTHPYLIRKGFPDHKSLTWEEKLVIPIRDWRGTLLSIQLIQEDGTKRFQLHTKVKGGRFVLGSGPERWVVEGFATGLSVKAALDSLYRRATRPGRLLSRQYPRGRGVGRPDRSGS